MDLHPDSFTAGFLIGRDAARARVEKTQDSLPIDGLRTWLQKHTQPGDTLVVEASANSFAFVEEAQRCNRVAIVLESHQCAQVGKTYCANDRVDAIKLARIHLSGLAKKVWVPDDTTRQRREVFYAHAQAVTDSTRSKQRLKSFLNQHRIRLPKGFRLTVPMALERLLAFRPWEQTQSLLIKQYLRALTEAEMRRKELREEMARTILTTPELLRLIRLCGLRHITAYALAAFIGDITRFAGPKQLVAYIGVNPGVCQSGNSKGSTSLRHNGCAPVRTLMIQAAHAIMRCPQVSFARWGYQLMMRRGRHRAVVGVARKLVTAVWHCLSGNFTAFDEEHENIALKISRLVTELGNLKQEVMGRACATVFKENLLNELRQSHGLVFRTGR